MKGHIGSHSLHWSAVHCQKVSLLTKSVVNESSVVERDFKLTVGLYRRAVVFYCLVKIHPEVFYLPSVVISSGQITSFTSPVKTQRHNLSSVLIQRVSVV